MTTNPILLKDVMQFVTASLIFLLLSGCANKEEQKKEFRGHVAANYVLIVVQTEMNFGLIGKILEGWQEYGVDYANNLNLDEGDFSGIDEFMAKMRTNKEADIELYMAVNDLYDVAVKVDGLKSSQAGYSLLTYVAKAKSLKEEWDTKKSRVELLVKSIE